jgi:hypothetical protein
LARCPSNKRGKFIADPKPAWPPVFERIEAGGCARIVVSRHPASTAGSIAI